MEQDRYRLQSYHCKLVELAHFVWTLLCLPPGHQDSLQGYLCPCTHAALFDTAQLAGCNLTYAPLVILVKMLILVARRGEGGATPAGLEDWKATSHCGQDGRGAPQKGQPSTLGLLSIQLHWSVTLSSRRILWLQQCSVIACWMQCHRILADS